MRKKSAVWSFLVVTSLLAPCGAGGEELSEEQIRAIVEKARPFIEAEVQRRVKEELQKQRAAEKTEAPPPPTVTREEVDRLVEQTVDRKLEEKTLPVRTDRPWSPAQPIPLLRSGPAYLNLSVVGDVTFGWSTTPDVEAIQGAHHDPSQRGFTLQGLELTFDGAVDPYFKAMATIPFVLEPGGETAVELEEAWVQTTSLPWNLQVKAGQMYASFGRQNSLHLHNWAFVDQSLVVTRLLGPDGLRNPGAQLSWLAPTPFFAELTLGVFNSDGETAAPFRNEDSIDIHGGDPVDRTLRGPQDLLYVPRLALSWDLGEEQTILLGTSGALGPNNSGRHARTYLIGGDLYWKWRPVNAEAGFPFVSWQTEGIYRNYRASSRLTPDDPPGSAVPLPPETLSDWGIYSQLLWGLRRGWVVGLRGEWTSADDGKFESDLRVDRARLSPNLTWYPTEFSKLRLQYNYDHIQHVGDEHSVWLQLEFLLGAHAAHKF